MTAQKNKETGVVPAALVEDAVSKKNTYYQLVLGTGQKVFGGGWAGAERGWVISF